MSDPNASHNICQIEVFDIRPYLAGAGLLAALILGAWTIIAHRTAPTPPPTIVIGVGIQRPTVRAILVDPITHVKRGDHFKDGTIACWDIDGHRICADTADKTKGKELRPGDDINGKDAMMPVVRERTDAHFAWANYMWRVKTTGGGKTVDEYTAFYAATAADAPPSIHF